MACTGPPASVVRKTRRLPATLAFRRAHHRRQASSSQMGFGKNCSHPPASLGSPDFSKAAPLRRPCWHHISEGVYCAVAHAPSGKRRHSGDPGPFKQIWRCRQGVKVWCCAHADSVFKQSGAIGLNRRHWCDHCWRSKVAHFRADFRASCQ